MGSYHRLSPRVVWWTAAFWIGLSATVSADSALDENETQQGCVIFNTVPVPPYPGGGGGYDASNISGNTLTLPGGSAQRIWLELWISNWACSGHTMGRWRAQYGRYLPDDALPPGILRPTQECATDEDCWEVGFGPGAGALCGFYFPGLCEPLFIQQPPQQPTALGFDIEACSGSSLDCRGLQVSTPPVVDDGMEHYAMTIVLEVTSDFESSAQINVRDLGDRTVFVDENGAQVPIGKAIPAIIEVPLGRCCDADGTCTDGVPQGLCGTAPSFIWQEGLFCPQVGGPPCVFPGACCDGKTGQCTDSLLPDECFGDQREFFEHLPCAEIECEPSVIPTVSSWGLLVLAMVLLVGGKVASARVAGHSASD